MSDLDPIRGYIVLSTAICHYLELYPHIMAKSLKNGHLRAVSGQKRKVSSYVAYITHKLAPPLIIRKFLPDNFTT